ncbi:hypothetical protein CW368_04745 [Actinomycetales bacterium SN12]|nr:hypothetical protein CW368_04745 [Actinomycetales bacterium SN12]
MSEEQIAFHVSYASVESPAGDDPTAVASDLLRSERVLAASRGFDGDEAVYLIPVTESGDVVALGTDDRLRFDLNAIALQQIFEKAGLTLHLGASDDALEEVDQELDEEFGAAFEQLDDPAAASEDLGGFGMPDSGDDDGFAVEPVRVAEFSRRGPWGARITAQLTGVDVDYVEAGTWSLYCYATGQSHGAVSSGSADEPIIEVNLPQHGEVWVEVTAGGCTGMFWPNIQRFTEPVLDLEAIAVPESAEVYRRMLLEADGAGDELRGLRLGDALDIEAATQACAPEALGGTVGETERIRTFVAAFGVPATLVTAGIDGDAAGRRFSARGWPRTVADLAVGGITEVTALTRRERPLARAARFLRERPTLGAAIGVAELTAGIAATRTRSGAVRGLGALMIVDAIVDLVIWVQRSRRR